MSDHIFNGPDASVSAYAKQHACGFGRDSTDGACEQRGVEEFEGLLPCERHVKEAEARERKDHWEEVDVYLSMWTKIAQARGNETLLRLLEYAQIEARTDRMHARKVLERAMGAGR